MGVYGQNSLSTFKLPKLVQVENWSHSPHPSHVSLRQPKHTIFVKHMEHKRLEQPILSLKKNFEPLRK